MSHTWSRVDVEVTGHREARVDRRDNLSQDAARRTSGLGTRVLGTGPGEVEEKLREVRQQKQEEISVENGEPQKTQGVSRGFV